MNRKRRVSIIAIYSIMLFAFMITFFVIPFPKSAACWIAFVFTVVAFVASLGLCLYAFWNHTTIEGPLYSFPVFRVGFIYLIMQLMICATVCRISLRIPIPAWIVVVLSVISLAVAAVCAILVESAKDVVEQIEQEEVETTRNITYFRVHTEGISNLCKDDAVRAKITKLEEKIKYSDPVSGAATVEIESRIKEMIVELKYAVTYKTSEEVMLLVEEISNLLAERNRLCKSNK